ncbi:hypothetical protein SASPL_157917 [Salvia splendens]|uniref:Uncharacterized protein n=1 Tax=Salvia splendens TaxID=180675 RepID=A0A8X8YU48_SALSN|nr:hypothetical protein SASPL_157917 [Salvia splendens]
MSGIKRNSSRVASLLVWISVLIAVSSLRGVWCQVMFNSRSISSASIRKKAAEVGARVDALHSTNRHPMKPSWFQEEIDLNKQPEPEPAEPATCNFAESNVRF